MPTDTSVNRHAPLLHEPFSDKRNYSRLGLRISLAKHTDEIEHVYRLVHDAYLEKGYCEPIEAQTINVFNFISVLG